MSATRILQHGTASLRRFFSTQRPLTHDEQAFLAHHFGESIPLDRIRLAGGGHPFFPAHAASAGRAWQPLRTAIQLPDGYFEGDDPSAGVRDGRLGVLAHEALHVWQRQRGRAVSLRGIAEPLMHRDPYAWRELDSQDPQQLLERFLRARIEQQARMFEEHVLHARNAGAIDPKWSEIARYVREAR